MAQAWHAAEDVKNFAVEIVDQFATSESTIRIGVAKFSEPELSVTPLRAPSPALPTCAFPPIPRPR